MPMRRTDVFRLPPPATPPAQTEPSLGKDVAALLQACSNYIAQARADSRMSLHELREMGMKVSELSSKVDELISTAVNVKNSQDMPVTSQPAQEDDPEVQALADRIDAAIKVLKGDNTSTSPASSGGVPDTSNPNIATPPPSDPNAPAV